MNSLSIKRVAIVVAALFAFLSILAYTGALSARAQDLPNETTTSSTPVSDVTSSPSDTSSDTSAPADSSLSTDTSASTDAPADTTVTSDSSTSSEQAPADTTVASDTTTDTPAPSDVHLISDTPLVYNPTLTTDQADYSPGETVNVTGSFFGSLKNYIVHIFGNSEVGNHYADITTNVTADANGSFSFSNLLDNFYRPVYTVTASTPDGTQVATATFTDAASAGVDVYSQCANNLGAGPCSWTNGDLNSSNSKYFENDATVQRLVLSGLANGSHTVTIEYQTTKGGKHAYDYLTDDTYSETYAEPSAVCDSPVTSALPSCTSLSPVLSDLIPTDSNANGKDFLQASRHFKIRNGSWVTLGTPQIVSGTYGSDSLTDIQLTFNVSTSTCADKITDNKGVVTCTALITWGAHVSSQADWGQGNSAVNISGSPYHVKVVELDGSSIGNRDNQMAASAVVLPNTITIHKITSPNGGTGFGFTTTGLTPASFSLDDNGSQVFTPAPGSFTITENNPSPAYALTNLACGTQTGATVTTSLVNRQVSITIPAAGGAVVDCTYTNTLQQAHLTLHKVVTNDNGGTAQNTQWILDAAGPTHISGHDGDAAISSAAVNAGAYTLSENSGPANYTGSTYSCVNNGGNPVISNSITLAPGDNAVCTVTNNDNAPQLHLRKTVTNDNGGTAPNAAWTLSATGTGGSPTNLSGSTPVDSEATFKADTYALAESGGPSGYTAGAWSCPGATMPDATHVTVPLGGNVTCTINNNDNTPSLTLDKIVVNDNGGTAAESAWTLTANGGAAGTLSGPGAAGHTDVVSGSGFKAGTYALSESAGPTGYTASQWSCVKNGGDPVLGSSITLGLGDTATCTITNDDQTAHLKLVKVINDTVNGGKTLADFPLTASVGVNAILSGTSGTAGVDKDVNAGTYALAETTVNGYTPSAWSCTTGSLTGSNLVLGLGQSAICTITNVAVAPNITLTKVVQNSFGGTAGVNDFDLTIGGTSVTSGQTLDVQANTPIALNEAGKTGYQFVSITGDAGCPSVLGGTATLQAGDSLHCTITNKDLPGEIHGMKFEDVNGNGTKDAGDNGLQGWTINISGPNNFSASTVTDANGNYSFTGLSAGTYTLTETAQSGWAQTTTNPAPVLLANGQTVNNVNFGNFHLVSISVNKFEDLNGDHTKDSGEPNLQNWTITLDKDDNGSVDASLVTDSNGNGTFSNLGPGTYRIREVQQTGWVQTRPNASFGGAGAQADGSYLFTVTSGSNITGRQFGNFHLGSLTIVKNTVGGDATFNFTGTGTSSLTSFGITTSNNTGSQTFSNLLAGTYTAAESAMTGWALTNLECTAGGTPNLGAGSTSVLITSGANVTCTFTNNKPQAKISITPLSAYNEVNHNHVITATVMVNNGDGNYATAADGTLVDFNITNSNGSNAAFVGGNTCTTTAGTCSVTINATHSGSVSISAATDATILGVSVHAATGTGGDNGDSATKVYEDAQILISANSTNEVGQDHTFTVTVKKDLGDSNGLVAAQGETVEGSISGGTTGSVTGGTCSTGTDVSGQCTIIVHSAIAGVAIVHASTTLTLNGVAIHRETGDGLSSDSSDTKKTWVDASISLTPATAVNNVNDPHTITAHVVTDDGTSNAPADGATVHFGMTTGTATFVGGVDSCVTDSNGNCSVQIVDNQPGDNTVDATTTVTVGGVTLTRATDGNAGPNGSGSAEKAYEAGKIVVKKVTDPATDSTTEFNFTPNYEGAFALKNGGENNSGWIATGAAYNVSETLPDGWIQSAATCDNGNDPSAITVANGQTVTCTFHNTELPKLTVKKVVTNDNGGTLKAGDVPLFVDGASVTNEVAITTSVGTHIASETEQTGYTGVIGGDCDANGSVDLAPGDNKTCIITNDDIAPRLHLRKTLLNDNGGQATLADFTLKADGAGANDISGTSPVDSGATLKADAFVLSETGVSGYSASDWVCDGGSQSGSSITLGLDEEATCTITNDDIAPSLTLDKIVANHYGGTAHESDWTLTADSGGAGTLSGPGATGNTDVASDGTFQAGTYTLSESTGPSGYSASDWSCVKNDGAPVAGASVTLGIGDKATCTITNSDIQPQLTVIKHVINDNGDIAKASDFEMDVTANAPSKSVFQGSEDPGETITISAGDYSVDEADSKGYTKSLSADCKGTIAVGEHKTCTITNNDIPHATRTQGFWQTHTDYALATLAAGPFGHGPWPIGLHTISNQSSLFSAFYASISKKSDGKTKRSAVDQARMQMLQQWVAAKLNCAAFGCSAGTQTLLNDAATAWGQTNVSANILLGFASQLDAYNNSNDALTIAAQGKATPKVSQADAAPGIASWDNLP